jgi:hypothetical protein
VEHKAPAAQEPQVSSRQVRQEPQAQAAQQVRMVEVVAQATMVVEGQVRRQALVDQVAAGPLS